MKGVDQVVNGGHAVLFSNVGQMSIACGCGGTGVAKDCLNMAQAQTLFE
jgi:hypothetical protein